MYKRQHTHTHTHTQTHTHHEQQYTHTYTQHTHIRTYTNRERVDRTKCGYCQIVLFTECAKQPRHLFLPCRWLKQEVEAEKTTQELSQGPKLDLGFKAGQTITLNIGVSVAMVVVYF